MNPYITDTLAREHADRLMADAAAHRRARRARSAHKVTSRTGRTESRADRSPAPRRSAAAAFQSWLTAGQL